jgi:rare lipoprotein A
MKNIIHILIASILAVIFSSKSYAHKYGPYKVGKPYKTASGKSYTPKEVTELEERGIASWYGEGFEGKMTANGGIFDSNLKTVAHRTLPMPSAVLITNLTNGKMTVAVVNDRGPFSDTEGRLVDVSKQVARDLDFVSQGRANVEIEYIPSLSNKLKNGEDINQNEIDEIIASKQTPPAVIVENLNISQEFSSAKAIGKTVFNEQRDGQAFYVQAGVFEILYNAQELYKKLVESVPFVQIRSEKQSEINYYIVRSGPFKNQESAQNSLSEIEKLCTSCKPMIIVM